MSPGQMTSRVHIMNLMAHPLETWALFQETVFSRRGQRGLFVARIFYWHFIDNSVHFSHNGINLAKVPLLEQPAYPFQTDPLLLQSRYTASMHFVQHYLTVVSYRLWVGQLQALPR